ncbi:FK506-binding protein 1 [Rhodosporidiobolus nylandii]
MFSRLLTTNTAALSRRAFSSTARNMGVTVENIAPGDGVNFPKPGDRVTIHYHGTLHSTGAKFDSSCVIGRGQVIKGWDEGVPQLSVGQKAKLICTPDYAYGARGFPPVIPANSTLVFEVELLKIN